MSLIYHALKIITVFVHIFFDDCLLACWALQAQAGNYTVYDWNSTLILKIMKSTCFELDETYLMYLSDLSVADAGCTWVLYALWVVSAADHHQKHTPLWEWHSAPGSPAGTHRCEQKGTWASPKYNITGLKLRWTKVFLPLYSFV